MPDNVFAFTTLAVCLPLYRVKQVFPTVTIGRIKKPVAGLVTDLRV